MPVDWVHCRAPGCNGECHAETKLTDYMAEDINNGNIREWAKHHGVMPEDPNCPHCGFPMKEDKRNRKEDPDRPRVEREGSGDETRSVICPCFSLCLVVWCSP